MEVILGVDVSSQTLDACLQSPRHAEPMFKKVANSSEGCQQLLRWARSHKVTRCAMEATGGYELAIGQRLAQAGIKLYIANPNRVRHFAKGDGIMAKTDKVDAFVIAEFARKSNLPAAFAFTPVQLEFKRLIARRLELKQYMRAERCRMRLANAAVLQSHEIVIRALEAEIERIGHLIDTIEEKHPDITRKVQILSQQKGIGRASAQALIALIPELGHIDRRKIASLVGLAPFAHESGKKNGKRFISGGRAEARRCLYMPAWVATRYDPHFAAFYRRLVNNGKPKKVAITAVMRKLLVRLNAMMKHQLEKTAKNA